MRGRDGKNAVLGQLAKKLGRPVSKHKLGTLVEVCNSSFVGGRGW
jgi:hypothetical protein